MENKTTFSYNELESIFKKYIQDDNEISIIKKAYEYASFVHKDAFRLNDDPRITHNLSVASIVARHCFDYKTITVALLHDVFKYGGNKIDILEKFGYEILNIVNEVHIINALPIDLNTNPKHQRKIVIGLVKDVKSIIVKLADRLHGMRTLYALSDKKSREKAIETLNIYAPVAHRLGLHKIKSELEDLSLRYYKSDVYFSISERLNKSKIAREKTVNIVTENVSNLLNEHGIKHKIKGRAKSIYSIYNKMTQGKTFEEIYDLFAMRVLVDTDEDCYSVMSIVHKKYPPLEDRYKDYIAMPKKNMYQSLHTTVKIEDGSLFEVQVRTYDMDFIAENGIAAHFAYKEKGNKDSVLIKDFYEQKLELFKKTMDEVEEAETELIEASEIFVFTPNGKAISLPNGATPIDFAYRVHTEVGHTMVGAIIGNSIVPLDYKLKDGQIIKINTNKSSKPNKDWINIAFSENTKAKIKSYFNKIDKEQNLVDGKEILEKEMRIEKIDFSSIFNTDTLKQIFKEFGIKDEEEMYLWIATEKITPKNIFNFVFNTNPDKATQIIERLKAEKKINIKSFKDILVEGNDNIKYNFADCCNPILGDEIIGFVTKGNGITIHRMICPNINQSDRLIDVAWNEILDHKYKSNILVISKEDTNTNIIDIVNKASVSDIVVNQVKTLNSSAIVAYQITVLVKNKRSLEKCINLLTELPTIEKVERMIR
ncbi:MAG: RelA/SpoT family protein [Bacilli bacterium]